MAGTKMSTAVANPLRTGIQLGVAAVLVELLDAFSIITMDERQYAALLAALTLVVGFIQNTIENSKGRALFRNPTPRTPVVGGDG